MPLDTRRVLVGLAVLLAVLVVADFFVEHHAAFGIDGTPGFAAWFGFGAAVAAVLIAYGFGRIARRRGEGGDA